MTYYAVEHTNVAQVMAGLAGYAANSDERGYWYALVDTSMRSLAHGHSERLNLYHSGKFDALSEAAPVLVDLGLSQHADWKAAKSLLIRYSGLPALSFVHCKDDLQTLGERWADFLEIASDDGDTYLLRFADTRCLPYMIDALESTRTISFFATFDHWLYVDRTGGLKALPLACVTHADALTDALSPAGLDTLLRKGLPDVLVDSIDQHFPELLTNRSGYSVYGALNGVSRLILRHEIDNHSDQVALAVAELSSEHSLVGDPEFLRWLDAVQPCAGSLATLLATQIE